MHSYPYGFTLLFLCVLQAIDTKVAESAACAMGHKSAVVAPLGGAYFAGAPSSEMMALRNETTPVFIPGDMIF